MTTTHQHRSITSASRTTLVSLLDTLTAWQEIYMHTPGAQGWLLTSGPIDRMVVIYPDDTVLCADRGGDSVITTPDLAAEWVRDAVPGTAGFENVERI